MIESSPAADSALAGRAAVPSNVYNASSIFAWSAGPELLLLRHSTCYEHRANRHRQHPAANWWSHSDSPTRVPPNPPSIPRLTGNGWRVWRRMWSARAPSFPRLLLTRVRRGQREPSAKRHWFAKLLVLIESSPAADSALAGRAAVPSNVYNASSIFAWSAGPELLLLRHSTCYEHRANRHRQHPAANWWSHSDSPTRVPPNPPSIPSLTGIPQMAPPDYLH